MEVSGQFHAPDALFPGKDPLYRRLGGPQSRSGRGGEEKDSQSSVKIDIREIVCEEMNWIASTVERTQ
jgi:hypothetical protein